MKKLNLSFGGRVEIVDGFISEVSRKDIVNPGVSFLPGGNAISIDFVIMEHNDGIKVQVVYAADEVSITSVEGVIEGVVGIVSIDELSSDRIFASVALTLLWVVMILVVILLIGSLDEITKWIFRKILKSKAERFYKIIEKLYMAIIILVFLSGAGLFLYKVTVGMATDFAKNSAPKMEKIYLTEKN